MEKELVNYKELIKSIIVFTIYLNSYLFRYIPIIIFNFFNIYQDDQTTSVLCSLISSIILVLVLLKIYWKELKKEFKIFFKNIFKNLDIGLICWISGLTIMVISNLILTYVLHSKGANNEIMIRELIKPFPLIMGINICLVGPFVEEIVFRKTLKNAFPNPILFVSASFLFFGTLHVSSYATNIIDWLYIIPYGTLGAAFAMMYLKSDTIYTSVFFHMLHNTLLFSIILLI